jgi:hypothetical protein
LLGTLAAAYAEVGRFDEAVKTAEQARQMALQANLDDLVKEFDHELTFYRARQPFRDASLMRSPQ